MQPNSKAPEATAVPQVKARILSRARWAPTRLDEQAVSTATAGPVKPTLYATRPGATLAAEPAQQRRAACSRWTALRHRVILQEIIVECYNLPL